MTPGSTNPAAAMPAANDACVPRCSGPSLFAPAAQILASETAAARFLGQLVEAVGECPQVALRVAGLGSPRGAPARLARLCERIAAASCRAGVDASRLELTLSASALTPDTAWSIRTDLLGAGTLNLLLDAASMRAARTHDMWRQLWQLRDARLRTAFWPAVTSPCALLSAEAGCDVVPGIALQGPARSAWVVCELELAEFCNEHAEPDPARLEAVVTGLLRAADRVHELARWPTAAMRHDSWLNRRVAVMPGGIGELARRARLDPAAHASLATLGTTLALLRGLLVEASRRAALRRDMLPAIACTDPSRQLPRGVHRAHWKRRWRHAAGKSRIGHRNLLVMSPWSVFPAGHADFHYADLLPLLRFADACTFGGRPTLAEWSSAEYVDFHRRAWALSQATTPSLAVSERL